jgi:serine/threonine protein kinase
VTFDELRAMAGAIPKLDNEEELIRAIEFLHELGSIVYFRKPGLSDIVILDPRWLTEVMATVVSSKTSVDRGILSHKFLFSHIWKGDLYPSHLHPTLLLLLEKFQISFRMRRRRQVLRATKDVTGPTQNQLSFRAGDKILLLEKPKLGKWWKGVHNGQIGYFQASHVEETDEEPDYTLEEESLVPCLLPVEPPSSIDKEWPQFEEDRTISQVARNWKFDFLPLPFFSQLIVRMLHFTDNRILWRHGMIVENAKGTASCYMYVNHSTGFLSVAVRSNQQQALMDMMSMIEEEIDTVRDWFGVNFLEVTVPCSHCYKARKEKPYLFNMDLCELAAAEDKKVLICEVESAGIGFGKGGVEVPLTELVPDLAMAQYTKIPYQLIELGPFLGKGTFADVYKATYKSTTVAVKQLKNTKGFKEFRSEVKFMSMIEHPNVVMLKGICLNPPCIVTEFMELGNLHAFLEDPTTTLTWKLCLSIAEDVAKGMNFLHSQSPPKIHRDLKSPNILLTNRKGKIVAKVGDFGTARALAPTIGGRIVGNPIWLAPEVMRNEEYTEKADVYSYGIILWEIFSRQFPFGNKTVYQIELDVVEGKRPEFPNDCPPFYSELASDCWHPDPSCRPTFKTILDRLKTSLPVTYKAKSAYQCEGALNAKIEKDDLLFQSADKVAEKKSKKEARCYHKHSCIIVPSDFLKNECEEIDYEEHFLATHQLSNNAKSAKDTESVAAGSSSGDGNDTLRKKEGKGKSKDKSRKNGSLRKGKEKVDSNNSDENDASEAEDNPSSSSKEELFLQYGFHRVLDEPLGTLPQVAKRLDNTPSLMNSHEVLLSLSTICIESGLMQHIKRKYSDITSGIMDIVPEHGKMHDPALNLSGSEGGFILGTVQEIGDSLYRKLDMKEGDRVIPICSLSSIPLRIISIGNSIGDRIINVKGHAVVFGNSSFISVPQDIESEVALLAVETAAALSQVNRFAKSDMSACIIGCGRVGLVATCYLRKFYPSAKIYCIDISDYRIETAISLKKADSVQKVNAQSAHEMLGFMKKHATEGFDVVLNCTTAPNIEPQALLITHQGGTVILCSYAGINTNNILNCSADVSVVLGAGACQASLVAAIFDLLQSDVHLKNLFTTSNWRK